MVSRHAIRKASGDSSSVGKALGFTDGDGPPELLRCYCILMDVLVEELKQAGPALLEEFQDMKNAFVMEWVYENACAFRRCDYAKTKRTLVWGICLRIDRAHVCVQDCLNDFLTHRGDPFEEAECPNPKCPSTQRCKADFRLADSWLSLLLLFDEDDMMVVVVMVVVRERHETSNTCVQK